MKKVILTAIVFLALVLLLTTALTSFSRNNRAGEASVPVLPAGQDKPAEPDSVQRQFFQTLFLSGILFFPLLSFFLFAATDCLSFFAVSDVFFFRRRQFTQRAENNYKFTFLRSGFLC